MGGVLIAALRSLSSEHGIAMANLAFKFLQRNSSGSFSILNKLYQKNLFLKYIYYALKYLFRKKKIGNKLFFCIVELIILRFLKL